MSKHTLRRGRRYAVNESTLLPSTEAPQTVPNLVYWVSSDFGVYSDTAGTIPANAGDKVAFWRDRQGFANFSQSISANRPTWQTNILNGKPGMFFPQPSAVAMATTHVSFAQPYTIFCVVNPLSRQNAFNVICDGAGNKPQIAFEQSPVRLYLFAGAQGFSPTQITFGVTANVVAIFNSTTSVLRWGGVTLSSTLNPSTGAIQDTILGSDSATAGTQGLNMYLHEFLLYSRILSSTEYGTIEAYFTAKYGIV